METFFASPEALQSIVVPERMRQYHKLLTDHVQYSKILVKESIVASELQFVQGAVISVRRRGIPLYPEVEASDEPHKKPWITANSHYLTHFAEYIRRYGVPRNTWVFAFENFLKGLRRYYQRHMSGNSEGFFFICIHFRVSDDSLAGGMMRMAWSLILIARWLEVRVDQGMPED
jgi:hypothetical protein